MNPIESLIQQRNVLVCVGSGGVGKTTTSAVLALHAALSGKKVLVLTIDPAKRLANSLGLDQLSNEPTQVNLTQFRERHSRVSPESDNNLHGEMWAMMLDMKESFDHVVCRYAPDGERDKILNSRIYSYFSTSLAGTQDYAAAERLYDMYETGSWDLIVLDTPPSTHAIDFLDAPKKLEDAIDNRALQWLYRPSVLAGKKGLGVLSSGTSYVLKTLARLTGGELLQDLGVFLSSFSTLFDGLNERAKVVRELLSSEASAFIVVTSPDPATLDEAASFHKRLVHENIHIGAFVVNRVQPQWASETELNENSQLIEKSMLSFLSNQPTLRGSLSDSDLQSLISELRQNVRQYNIPAESDRYSISKLSLKIPSVPVQKIPLFPSDIHSLDGLERIRSALIR